MALPLDRTSIPETFAQLRYAHKMAGVTVATYTMNIGLNKMAVAEEVISSAGNILVAAGFEPDEIAALFNQAADQLASGDAITQANELSNIDNPTSDDIDIDHITSGFEEIASVKSLAKLKRRADALDRPHDNVEALEKCYSLAEKMIPLIGEAQDWLRHIAKDNGIEVIDDHNEWTSSVSDEELDREHEIIFICEFDWSYPLSLDFVDSVISELVEKGDEKRFSHVVGEIEKHGISIPSSSMETIEQGKAILALKCVFWDHVLSQSAEVQETQFLDSFVKSTGFPRPSYFLIGWLQQMEEGGLVERYKASNRWRLRVV
jgi:hypothetical protein